MIAGTWLFHEHLPASPVRLGLRLTGIALAALVLVTAVPAGAGAGPRPGPGQRETVPGYLADVRRR